jgi:hypothetical protein
MKYLWFYAALVILSGCNATTGGPVQGICGVVPLGQNDAGILFVRVQCQQENE